MMIGAYMIADTAPHLYWEAHRRLKIDLEAKGLKDGHRKYATVFYRKRSKYLAKVLDDVRKNPCLDQEIHRQYKKSFR